MNNRKLIIVFRVCIVIFTIGAFLNKFIDDMMFNDAKPEYLIIFKNAGKMMDDIKSTIMNGTNPNPTGH
jgi:hypothetical protein